LGVSRYTINVCESPFPEDQRQSKGYNSRVNAPEPSKPVADAKHEHHHRHAAYAAEATGLLFMAVLLLVIIIIRYWRFIPWSAR
jgi:hypothetical protein